MTEPSGGPSEKLVPMQHESPQAETLERIRAELAALGPCLPGSLVERVGPCGKQACACHQDPARHHGPFHSWTRKIDGKTVTRLLSDDELASCQVMFENKRRLKELTSELEQIGLEILERDDRRQPA
jgi:hypothetical protein